MSVKENNNQVGQLELLSKSSSWIRLMSMIPQFGNDALMLVIATVAINLLALAMPLALMQVYDRIIPNSSLSTLSWLMIGVSSAIILETILKILRNFNSNWLSARMEHILNTEAVKYFLSARLDEFERDNSGVHFERFNSINVLRSYFSGQLLLVLLDIPFALLFIYMLYYLGGNLYLYTVGLIVVLMLLLLIAKSKFEKHNEDTVEMNKEYLDFIIETLGGIHTVKSMNMEDKIHRKFENIEARMSSASLSSNTWKSVPTNAAQFIIQLNMLGIIFLGADMVISGVMTVGAMTACTMMASRGIQPIIKFAGSWLRFSEVTVAQKQLLKIIELKSPHNMNDASMVKDIDGTVSFENITMKNEGGRIIVDNFNKVIHAGEFIGVKGDDHEQTTALMLMLCGIYTPTSGHVYIDEYLVAAMDHSHFNGKVEYLSKRGRIFNGTILDNIALFDANKREAALDTASLLELDGFVSKLPHGYQSVVDQRSNDSLPLSMIQRICIARALITRPRILIIDRTFNSLDLESAALLVEVLETLRGKCTLFMVSDYGNFPLEMNRVIECSGDGVKIS